MSLNSASSSSLIDSIDDEVGVLPVHVLDDRLDLLEEVREQIDALVGDVVDVVDRDRLAVVAFVLGLGVVTLVAPPFVLGFGVVAVVAFVLGFGVVALVVVVGVLVVALVGFRSRCGIVIVVVAACRQRQAETCNRQHREYSSRASPLDHCVSFSPVCLRWYFGTWIPQVD